MDIKMIRRMNVRLLEREVGSLSGLARMAGTSQSYLSQCVGVNAVRSIGDELARRLEHAMKKPSGWMDETHVEESHVSAARQVYDRLLHLPPAKIHALAELLDINLDSSAHESHVVNQAVEGPGRVITLEDNGNQKKQRRGQ